MAVSYETVRPGDGKHVVQPGDVVSVHYTTILIDGRVVDTSKVKGRTPFSFTVGNGTVIDAWDKVLPGMTLGQTVRITSSSDAAYGSRGIPPYLPGDASVKFEITLLSIHSF